MSGWLLAAAVAAGGGLLVWLATVVVDYLPARAVQSSPPPPTAPARRVRVKAADVLGYRDLAGRWVPPTHPLSAGAATSAAALAAWEGRR